MAHQSTTGAPPITAKTALVCRLRPKQLRRGHSPTAGEIELENASGEVVEIEADMHPLQHLNLVVTDSTGAVVSEQHYGDRFSPLGKMFTLRLLPGEKYTHVVSLLGTVPEKKRLPGSYVVRAVYDYNGCKVDSDPLDVQMPPSK